MSNYRNGRRARLRRVRRSLKRFRLLADRARNALSLRAVAVLWWQPRLPVLLLRFPQTDRARQALTKRALDRGHALLAAGRYAAALRPLRAATLLEPSGVTARRKLASCLAALQRWDDATRLLEDCRRRFPQESAFTAQLGALLLETGQVEEALTELAAVANLPDGNPRWLRWYTDALVQSGQRHLALDAARQLVARSPSDVQALHTAATVHLDYGLPGEAARYARKAQRLSPSPDGALLAVKALMAAGRDLEARAVAEVAVKAVPGDARSHGALAEVLLRTGQTEDACSVALTARDLDPKDLRWHVLLARCHDAAGDFERSRELLLTHVATCPRDPHVLKVAAGYFAQVGDVQQALELAERLVEVHPKAQSFVVLADYLQRLKRYDDSIGALQRAIKLDPQDAGAMATMGSILARQRRIPEAVEQLEAALTLRGDRLKWRLAVARLLLDLGNTERAREHLWTLLADNPQDPSGREQYARALLLEQRGGEAETYVDHTAREPHPVHVAFRHFLEGGHDERAFAYLADRHGQILEDVLAAQAVP